MVIPITIEGQHIYRRIIFSQSVRIDEPLIYCETPVKLQPFLAAKHWNPPDFCRTVIKKISKCKKCDPFLFAAFGVVEISNL